MPSGIKARQQQNICTFLEQKYFLSVIGVFKNTFESSKCR